MANLNSAAQRSFAAEPYDSVAAVLASKQITAALAGQTIHTKDGHAYQIPENQSITDWHVQTAGGAKMYVLPSRFSPEAFGCVGDGASDDSAPYRKFWLAARWYWYERGEAVRMKLSGKYLLNDPVQDHAYSIMVCDFPTNFEVSPGSEIMVGGSSTAAIFQFGLGSSSTSSASGVKSIDGPLQVRSLSGTHLGFRLRSILQGLLVGGGQLRAIGCRGGFTIGNCQEMVANLYDANSVEFSVDFEVGAQIATNGTNNNYTNYSGGGSNNNNEVYVTSNFWLGDGLRLRGGTNNRIHGVSQSTVEGVTGPCVKMSGGTGWLFDNLYLEGGAFDGSVRNTFEATSEFSGTATFVNFHTSTIGSRVRLNGSGVFNFTGMDIDGRLDVLGTSRVIVDRPPAGGGGGFYNGRNQTLVISDLNPVSTASQQAAQGLPTNKMLYRKGKIAGGGSFRFYSGGSDGSGAMTKGFKATLALVKDTSAPVMVEMYAAGSGTGTGTGSITQAIEEKIGTLASINAAIQATKASSSPTQIMYGDLSFAPGDASELSYEIWVQPFTT